MISVPAVEEMLRFQNSASCKQRPLHGLKFLAFPSIKTLIRFSNKQIPPLNMARKRAAASVFKCCQQNEAVRHMISDIYLLLHLLWTALPTGAITV